MGAGASISNLNDVEDPRDVARHVLATIVDEYQVEFISGNVTLKKLLSFNDNELDTLFDLINNNAKKNNHQ